MKNISFIYEEYAYFGKYSPSRKTCPPGLHAYDLRCADDSTRIATIEKNVRVNYAGTLFLDDPIPVLESDKEAYVHYRDIEDRGDLPTHRR